jgi:hypothetical protein
MAATFMHMQQAQTSPDKDNLVFVWTSFFFFFFDFIHKKWDFYVLDNRYCHFMVSQKPRP